MIATPEVVLDSYTETTVVLTVSTPAVTPPSASVAKRLLYGESSAGDAVGPLIVTGSSITVTGLATDRTWTFYVIAISNVTEVSAQSNRVVVGLRSFTFGGDAENFYTPPGIAEGVIMMPHELIAKFLDQVEYQIEAKNGLPEKVLVGRNVFYDRLPKWMYDQDDAYQADPGTTLILFTLDSSPQPQQNLVGSHYDKLDSNVTVEVYSDNADRAAREASRLWRFLTQQDNVIAGTTPCLSVRSIRSSDLPRQAGEDERGRYVYAFGVSVRSVIRS